MDCILTKSFEELRQNNPRRENKAENTKKKTKIEIYSFAVLHGMSVQKKTQLIGTEFLD